MIGRVKAEVMRAHFVADVPALYALAECAYFACAVVPNHDREVLVFDEEARLLHEPTAYK